LRGRVTFRGKPVENAVVYIAAGAPDKSLPGPAAVTGRDGSFSLKLNGAPGNCTLSTLSLSPLNIKKLKWLATILNGSGEAEASIHFHAKNLKDNSVPVGEYVTFEIVIEDERLVKEFNKIGDQVTLFYTVYNPEGEIVLQRTRQLSLMGVRDGELYLRESLKVDKGGEWRFIVEIRGAPYIDDTFNEKTLSVKSRWCITAYALPGVLTLAVLVWRKR